MTAPSAPESRRLDRGWPRGRWDVTGSRASSGGGGMGVVYRATDDRLGREVALKVSDARRRTSDPELDARLRREAQAAAALTHPAICVIYEIDEAEGATFIAMELVRGRPLASLSRSGLNAPWALDARHRGRGRAGRGPRARDRASRPQALQRHDHGIGPRQDHRLRPGQVLEAAGPVRERRRHPRPRPDRPGTDHRDRRLHVSGAGARGPRRSPQRRVRLRRAPLRDVVRRAGLPARDGRGDAARDPEGARAAAGRLRARSRRSRRPAAARPLPGQGPVRALPRCRRRCSSTCARPGSAWTPEGRRRPRPPRTPRPLRPRPPPQRVPCGSLVVDDEDPARDASPRIPGTRDGCRAGGGVPQRVRGGEGGGRARVRTSSCSTSRCPSSPGSRCWS